MKRTIVIGTVLAVFFATIFAPAQQRPGLGAVPPGTELWTRQFGSTANDGAHGVAVDARDNVLVVGWTEGILPGQKSAGESDAFVRKYSP